MYQLIQKSSTTNLRFSRPPVLAGYTYAAEDAFSARDENRLLALRLETNAACNLKCRYCYAESGDPGKEADFSLLERVVREAKELGAGSIVVIGGGEPTLYSRFEDLISFIVDNGMIPVIFSNTIAISKRLARFLYARNASVMGKLDSFRPEVQDYLSGRPGSFTAIQRGLRNLMDAGFSDPDDSSRLRLGVSFVCNRLNIKETDTIWRFCRDHNIFPNMEIITPTGRAKQYLAQALLEQKQIRQYKEKLLGIDRRNYGYDWLIYTPLTASGCLQHLYSLYITLNGDVRPCAPTKLDEHPALRQNGRYLFNVNDKSLKDIYDSELFHYVRHIDRHLEGKCRGCEYGDECIGCRGYAYAMGINRGLGPLEALKLECQQCFK